MEHLITVLLMGIGLSMDAFAVAVTKGITTNNFNFRRKLTVAAFFGVFQGIMPILGYFLGALFKEAIKSCDHFIAFALLSFIGGKMIIESVKEEENGKNIKENFDIKEILLLAIATSIDALAVGVTLSFVSNGILKDACIIALTTFIISYIGTEIGKKFGALFKKKSETAGGIILILIGVKILIEHLFFS